MQCLIIAAGLGSRLRSKAASKPLAEVAGRPLVQHIVQRARAGGASRFLIVTGYSPEAIEAFAAELAVRDGIEIETVRNEEWERPNGLSVLAAAPKLDRQFLLLMSDHLFEPEMLAGLIAAEDEGALTLAVDYRTDNPLIDLDDATKVEADGAGRIVRLGKTIEGYNCIDTGLFRARHRGALVARRRRSAGACPRRRGAARGQRADLATNCAPAGLAGRFESGFAPSPALGRAPWGGFGPF
jgi:choline kinase